MDGGRFTRDQPIQFGQLVVALGSVTNLATIPGMSEYGLPLKNVADALRLRSAVINRLEEANLADDREVRARLLTFVIVGGGYTGVETAGQVRALIRAGLKWYPKLHRSPVRVVLVHAGDELLPEIGAGLGAYARGVLERRGIEIKLKTRVREISARRVSLGEGSFIETHTVVTTIGNSPNPVVAEMAKELGLEAPKGRIAVEPTMQVPGHPGLWALGDCAAVPWSDQGKAKTAPPTAQFAVREGRQLGANSCAGGAGKRRVRFSFATWDNWRAWASTRRWRRSWAFTSAGFGPGGCGGPSTWRNCPASFEDCGSRSIGPSA